MILYKLSRFIIICFFVFTSLVSLSYAGNPNKITLGYQLNESYPYQMGYGETIANPPGIAVDILKAVEEKLKINIEFQRYPNKRVLMMLRSGKIDGAFMYSYNKSRLSNGQYPLNAGTVDYKKRIATLSYSLYVLEGSSLRWDGKKISGLNGSVGAGRGYSIVEDLKKKGVRVYEVNSVREGFNMLIKGRLSAFAAQETTADPLIKEKGYNTIEKLEVPLKSKPYFLMLSHQFVEKAPGVAEQLWETIGQVREEVVQSVVGKYHK